jgi:hypothetical protein
LNTDSPPTSDLPNSGDRWVTLFALLIPAVIAFHPLANNDLPMHLAVGDWIIEHGEVPTTDPFSANGHGGRWIAHEWLAALLFAATYKVAGATGLVALAVLLSTLLGALQNRISQLLGVPAVARLLLLVPIWMVAGRRLMLRPHLLGLCSVLGLWYVTLIGRKHPRLLWFAVPLMALWANLHSSFILGIAFLIFDLLVWPDGHRASARQRLTVLASCVGATALQPHGLGLFLFPFQLGLDPVFTSEVTEWVSPFASSISAIQFRATISFGIGVPTMVLALIAVWRQGTGFGGTEAPRAARLAVVVSIAMALLQQRHFALAALLASVLLGMWITPLCLKWPDTLHRVRRRAAILICAMVMMLIAYGYPARFEDTEVQWRKGGSGWSERLPRIPVSILANEWQVTGVVFCEYEYGSVVTHASDGRLKPTMDSRNTVYGAQRYLAHQAALAGEAEEQLRLLNLANAVLIRTEASRSALASRLDQSADWAPIHVDPYCRMWVRESAVPESMRDSLRPARDR